MIAVNQDTLGVQCRRIKTGLVDILVKPLENSKVAICVFNKSGSEKSTKIKLSKLVNLGFLNLENKSGYEVCDVWEDKYMSDANEIVASVPSHGVKVYIAG